MGDLTGGAYAAIGAALVAGFFWLLRQGFKTAVAAEFAPLRKSLEAHMENEEDARAEQLQANDAINEKLDAIHEQFLVNDLDHAEFRGRLDNLEQ
jgi:hypothetical protein